MLADMLPRVARPARTAILAVAVVTLAATTAAAGCPEEDDGDGEGGARR